MLRKTTSMRAVIGLLVFCLSLCPLTGLAQKKQGSEKSGNASPPGKELDSKGPVALESVKQDSLKPYLDRVVKVRGIIGAYLGDKRHYRFTTDDGSSVTVIGAFPDQGGTSYTIEGRVSKDGGTYQLQEITKTQFNGGGAAVKMDPLILAGVGLLALALVFTIVVVAKSKASAKHRALEDERIREEREGEEARKRADELRTARGEATPRKDTVANAPASDLPRAHTIESIGSLRVTGGPHKDKNFPIVSGETLIGRSKSENGRAVSVLLDQDGEVSSLHGSIISTIDGRTLYKDVSRNGSLVDGQPVHHSQCDLHAGSVIAIGGTTMEVTLRRVPLRTPETAPAGPTPVAESNPRRTPTVATEAPAPQRTPAPPTTAGFAAQFVLDGGPSSGKAYPMQRSRTTLGREEQDIELEDESVSRKHAVLLASDGKFILKDEKSTHGTLVNGQPVPPEGVALSDGDRVQLGKSPAILVFHALNAG